MATATDVATQTVVGTIAFVEDANQWGFAKVRVEKHGGGNWYGSTRSPGLIQAARNALGDIMAVDFKAVAGKKINPKTNQPYINNYIEAIRLPSADELPARQYGDLPLSQVQNDWTDGDIPFGQDDMEAAIGQELATLGGKRSPAFPQQTNDSQDEFRRSKEEMRYTEALKIAALAYGGQTGTVGTVALSLKADEIYALLERGPGQ